MNAELESLASARHSAYVAAKEMNFKPGKVTRAWRNANRAYVLAKDDFKYPEIEVLRALGATQRTTYVVTGQGLRQAA